MDTKTRQADRDPLEAAFERLEHMLPPKAGRVLQWLHDPKSRWVRIPLGVLFIIASFLWFLPVVGLEFLPIGLLLVAQDIPFLRKPVGRVLLRLLDGATWLKQRWQVWRSRRNHPSVPRGRR